MPLTLRSPRETCRLCRDADMPAAPDIPAKTRRLYFVPGSRHGQGSWAFRKFSDQPFQVLVTCRFAKLL